MGPIGVVPAGPQPKSPSLMPIGVVRQPIPICPEALPSPAAPCPMPAGVEVLAPLAVLPTPAALPVTLPPCPCPGGGGSGTEEVGDPFVVVAADGSGDFLTIQAAINAGASEIYVKGTLVPAQTTLPDRNVRITMAPNSVLSPTQNNLELFVIPNGLTALRVYTFETPNVFGNPSVMQTFIAFQDKNGRGSVNVNRPNISGMTDIFDIQAGDLSLVNTIAISVTGGTIAPNPNNLGHLVKTPNPHSTFAFGSYAIFTQVNPGVSFAGAFLLNYDGDLVLYDSTTFVFTGAGGATGFMTRNGAQVIGLTSSATDEIKVNSGVVLSNGTLVDTNFVQISIHPIAFEINMVNPFLVLGAKIIIDGPDNVVTGVRISGFGVSPASPAAYIDILVGADRAVISSSSFFVFDATVASIRNAAQKAIILGINFIGNSPGVKAFIDSGAGDFSLLTGCIGLGTAGANVTLGAHSSAVIGTGINLA